MAIYQSPHFVILPPFLPPLLIAARGGQPLPPSVVTPLPFLDRIRFLVLGQYLDSWEIAPSPSVSAVVAAICHKSWGSRPGATSFPFPQSILLFPSLSWTPQGVCSLCAEPAHPLPNILMQFMQSNSFIKSTLLLNVLPGTEISVHAEFSHCWQN